MPDHLHLIWMGLRRESDQLKAMKFLRTHLEPTLGRGRKWQHQPHDHVLREQERKRGAFATFCFIPWQIPCARNWLKRKATGPITEQSFRGIRIWIPWPKSIGKSSGNCTPSAAK